ncbi:Phosphoglycerate dehydrogenase [Clostridium sp. DL-VIII]|uniref:D-2-hydroxyacid dehydrogenase n=1 Tax=Clostridium sp. DL-VIII TaxID=641107 RepID=UPI00023AF117|nr:D-2-hydroxyacid dehydrogenase [Clostridium sp. DL-VIII]EHI97575.1 Phosphoglycerate dehydrogenase [Clostridium sp. DL-VIII]
MNANKILILLPVNEKQKALIQSVSPNSIYLYDTYATVDKEAVQSAEIIIGNPPAEMLIGSPNLKWLQLNSAGTDAYIKEGVLKEGVMITNATGAYGLAISEHIIGVLLQLLKKLHLYSNNQKLHLWKDEGEVKSIYNSKILIIGLGDIGEEFAKRVKAFGAYTIGVRRSNTKKAEYIDELHLMDKIDDLLPTADVVMLSLPSTKETYKMFSKDRLKLMKKGAVLLNVGRGNVLDTDALCDLVESNHLLGAGLDVTDPEPLTKEHRIWDIENIIITPHISGGYHLPETFERIVRISAENLERFTKDQKLKNIVDFKTGYRTL